MENTNFSLGDIVALLSHPYHENHLNIVISGEPLQQSPLMVVTQVLTPKDTEQSNIQYKCMWFSQKLQRFEEVWIFENLLKLIQKNEITLDHIPPNGTQVLFKTSPLEMQKRKSSFTSENTDVEKNITNISHLLSFVSPVLLVTGFKSELVTKGSERLSDRIEKDSIYIKVKWFNMASDKMNEALIPVCSLSTIAVNVMESLNLCQEAIKNNQYFKVKLADYITFLKPIGLNYLSGSYYLRAFDYIRNKMINNLNVNEIEILNCVDTPVLEKAPLFNFSRSKRPVLSNLDLLLKAVGGNNIIRIKYVSHYGTVTKRCIQKFSVNKGFEDEKEVFYLTGFCLSKMDRRHFNISRINWVEIIDLESLETT